MSDLAVTLTIEQLRALVREELRAVLQEEPPAPGEPITDDEMAEARKRFARRARR